MFESYIWQFVRTYIQKHFLQLYSLHSTIEKWKLKSPTKASLLSSKVEREKVKRNAHSRFFNVFNSSVYTFENGKIILHNPQRRDAHKQKSIYICHGVLDTQTHTLSLLDNIVLLIYILEVTSFESTKRKRDAALARVGRSNKTCNLYIIREKVT